MRAPLQKACVLCQSGNAVEPGATSTDTKGILIISKSEPYIAKACLGKKHVFFHGGTLDQQCPPERVQKTCRLHVYFNDFAQKLIVSLDVFEKCSNFTRCF